MNKEVVVRKATKEDMNDVIKILFDDDRAKEKDQYCEPLPQCYIDAYEYILNDTNDNIIVACIDNKVVGTAQLKYSRHLSHHGSFIATIEAVRVDKTKRSQGIGAKMIQYAIEKAKERHCSMVELTSHVSRTRAHEFYKRLGFEATHVGMKMEL